MEIRYLKRERESQKQPIVREFSTISYLSESIFRIVFSTFSSRWLSKWYSKRFYFPLCQGWLARRVSLSDIWEENYATTIY